MTNTMSYELQNNDVQRDSMALSFSGRQTTVLWSLVGLVVTTLVVVMWFLFYGLLYVRADKVSANEQSSGDQAAQVESDLELEDGTSRNNCGIHRTQKTHDCYHEYSTNIDLTSSDPFSGSEDAQDGRSSISCNDESEDEELPSGCVMYGGAVNG